MKTTLSKQYESRRPLAVLPLSNFGGLAILDSVALKKALPEIAAQFTKTTVSRRFVIS